MINKAAKEKNKFISKCLHKDEICDYRVYSDTDSVTGDTIIYVNNNKMKIDDFYNSSIGIEEQLPNGKYVKRVLSQYKTKTTNNECSSVFDTNIQYVMKHKTQKKLYKLTVNGKSVVVTEDHSLIVRRNNVLTTCTVTTIQKGDEFVSI